MTETRDWDRLSFIIILQPARSNWTGRSWLYSVADVSILEQQGGREDLMTENASQVLMSEMTDIKLIQ